MHVADRQMRVLLCAGGVKLFIYTLARIVVAVSSAFKAFVHLTLFGTVASAYGISSCGILAYVASQLRLSRNLRAFGRRTI